MKKILISIMTVAAMFLFLASCNEEFDDNPNSAKAIVFDNDQTRTIVNSPADILKMGVFAQINCGDVEKSEAGSNSYVMILNNEEVSRTSGTPWTYNNTCYWVKGRVFHFFAVWPYSGENSSVSNVTEVEPVNGDGPHGYSVTFETPETADQDLLTAKTKVETKTGEPFPPGVVKFTFNRALTNVNLKIWSNGAPDNVQDKIKVKKVTISNVSKKGTLNTTINDSIWNLSSTKMSFTKEYEGEEITVSQAQIIDGVLVPNEVSTNNPSKDSPAIPFGDGLLLIPHTINNSNPVVVTVIYDLQRPIDQTEGLWEEKKLQAFLPEGTWPAGKKLTYNLIISGERTITEFQINTVVEDWEEHPDKIDFTEQVDIGPAENKIHWVEGTYESLNVEKGEVVLYSDVDIVATCYFNIKAPVGATWTASLIPLTASAMDAFSIVEDTKYGVVGSDDMQPIKIRINNPDPISARNACKLRITVQTADGRSIVVKGLMPEGTAKGIEEYTIIQNLING